MVLDQVGWKSLGLFFTKDFGVASVMSGDLLMARIFFRQVQSDPAYKVLIFLDGLRSIDTLGEELCTFSIWTSEDDREVSVVDPATFPIYFGLHSCKPWVAKDGFVFTKVGEEELKGDCGRTGAYI